MYTITPKQAYDEILSCVSVGLTPLLTSSPGIGKSSLVQQLAREYNLKLIDLRLSQCTPEDLQGFPMRTGNKATFTPFDIFPLQGEEIPEGYEGWLLFLDEATSASKAVQAAAYKLILDRMVGSFKLHDQVAIVAAGNKASDKAVVNQLSTALQSRLIHFELEANPNEWTEHALKNGFDHRIISFITYMPSKLMDFRPDHQDKTFPCPRTWEFLSRLIKDKPVLPEHGARIAGTIGQGVAIEFMTFVKEFDRLPKLEDILANPGLVEVPREAGTKYAAISMLIERLDDNNLSPVLDYVNRYDIEFQIVFSRGANAKMPYLAQKNPRFIQNMRDMARYVR